MPYPDFITDFPSLDVPVPGGRGTKRSYSFRRGVGSVLHVSQKDFELPAHSHKAQWGTVIEGEVELTIGARNQNHIVQGDSYSIPSGVEHGGKIKAGTRASSMFLKRLTAIR